MKYILHPLSPQEIIGAWPHIVKGAEMLASERITGDETTVQFIFSQLLSGNMTCWLCMEDNVMRGWIMTQLMKRPTGVHYCLVYGLYGVDGQLSKEILDTQWTHINEYAKKNGCKEFVMHTRREKGMSRLLEPRGWKQQQVIFAKEVFYG